jgi:hypothetical protein
MILMENQEQEVILEEVVETEEKTKWYKSGWFKGTCLAVGGIVVGAVTATLFGNGSEDQDDGNYLEGSNDEEPALIESSQDDSYEIKSEEV